MAVLVETSLGDIVIDLKAEEAPRTCTNFLKLCKIKYYNNCLIFKVQKDYIAQTGDKKNNGSGGHSIYSKLPGLAQRYFADEIHPRLKHDVKGTVAMANERPNENGSQFYITLRDKVAHLDDKHTIFGTVAEGLEVLDKINGALVDENEAPYQNIRIWHTEVLEDPFPDPSGLDVLIPPKSPDVLKDEEFKTIEDAEEEAELQERMAKTLAKSQATTLELLHDLPDADIEVPDSDLFVYKLNPVTQDGDLELIFSRFGSIKRCEIVRDWKTGDSLQYGFITFENARECENAYFKMHDCVIDDRRIGVNFSQSVAKLWGKFRGGARMTAADAKDVEGRTSKGKGRGKGRGKGKAPTLSQTDTRRGSSPAASVREPAPGKEHERRSRSRGDDRDRGRSRDRRRDGDSCGDSDRRHHCRDRNSRRRQRQ